ncbi:MAG: heavy-metal-associated domain-containing protein [Clostridia bacterium]|nr:heavy-metal-associated domain-containing protein [Clostridia bacterium]
MRIVYKIEDMCCANCAAKLEKAIAELESVAKASVNFIAEKIIVETELEREALLEKIKALAAKIEPDCTVE